jgi:hypothetical protein
MIRRLALAALVVAGVVAAAAGAVRVTSAQIEPDVIVVETTQGTFAFELYAREAPVSVAHIEQLVKERFYDGQRVHRVLPGALVQFGDPQSRDLERRAQCAVGQRDRRIERQPDRRRRVFDKTQTRRRSGRPGAPG